MHAFQCFIELIIVCLLFLDPKEAIAWTSITALTLAKQGVSLSGGSNGVPLSQEAIFGSISSGQLLSSL